MKWFKLIALIALGLYLALVALVYFTQRKFLYFPPPIYLIPEAVGLLDIQEIEIRSGDNSWATAWWVPPSNPEGRVVMFFHGNGSAVYSNYDIYKDIIEQGHGVWALGYPGYPGRALERAKPSQTALVGSAVRQYDWLIAEGMKPENIIFFGTSLGSGVAAQLAEQYPPALLIMDAPFNSILDMGRKQMPFLPVRWLMKDQYRSDQALMDLDVPLVWIHGTTDTVIPLMQGQKLYDGYGGPKSAHIIQGGQHTNLWGLGGREIVLAAIKIEN